MWRNPLTKRVQAPPYRKEPEMNLNDLTRAATHRGQQDGRDAASWYFDSGRRETTRTDYQRVLKGIADGDPEIMDTLPSSPLSGEFADSMTPNKLYEELGVVEYQLRNWESSGELDGLCQAYEDAFHQAAQDAIEQECHTNLEQDVAFIINVKTELDPEPLLSQLVDLLMQQNCDLNEESFEID